MSVIDDYLKQYKPPVSTELVRIRAIAHKLLSGYEETISYGMPTIKYKGESIIGFDARKNYIGIYPFSGHVITEIKELKDYSTTKGAIHEKLDNLMPDSLIEKIIKERLRQADF